MSDNKRGQQGLQTVGRGAEERAPRPRRAGRARPRLDAPAQESRAPHAGCGRERNQTLVRCGSQLPRPPREEGKVRLAKPKPREYELAQSKKS